MCAHVCPLNTEAHCVTTEWGVAGKRDAEALKSIFFFFFTLNSISHLLPAGRESVQYLFCFCFKFVSL